MDLVKEYLLIWKLKQSKDEVPKEWAEGKKGDVILIQGLGENWRFLKYIGDYINSYGFRVHILTELRNNTESVENGVKIVERYLQENKLNKVILVTHSKGGVIAKYLLDYSPQGKRVKKIIAIATPFKGSILANIPLEGANQLTPGSNLIRKVNAKCDQNRKIVSIFPKFDNHVMPISSSNLEGAINIQVDINGHTRILESPQIMQPIRQVLSLT